MTLAKNDNGDYIYQDEQGNWTPAKMAKNPTTGEMIVFNGQSWQPVASNKASAGQKTLQAADKFSEGLMRSVGGVAAAVPDLVADGMRAIGLPAPEENAYSNIVQGAITKLGRATPQMIGDENYRALQGPVDENSLINKTAYGAGNAVGDAASMFVPAAATARMAKAGSTAGRVAQTLTAQPKMQAAAAATGGGVAGATDNPWLGLATSVATPMAVSGAMRTGQKAMAPVANQLSGEEQRLIGAADQIGIKATPGQATGSPALLKTEQMLAQLPFSGPKQQAIYDTQRTALNRAALKTAGIDADAATPDVIDRAFRDLGKTYDELTVRTQVVVDPKFKTDLQSISKKYKKRLPTDVAGIFESYVDDIGEAVHAANRPGVQRVTIDGDTYKNIASDLRATARKSKENPHLSGALDDLTRALDDVMERSTTPELREVWRETRRRYRNLKTIDRAMAGAPSNAMVSGDIPFNALKNAVKASDKSGFSRGRGDLNDIARIGMFLSSKTPRDSGTPIGNAMANILTAGGAGGGSTAALLGEPISGAAVAGSSLALPPLAQKFINSDAGRAWLMRQSNGFGPRRTGALTPIIASQTPGQLLGE
jgi:hypothetical protein